MHIYVKMILLFVCSLCKSTDFNLEPPTLAYVLKPITTHMCTYVSAECIKFMKS